MGCYIHKAGFESRHLLKRTSELTIRLTQENISNNNNNEHEIEEEKEEKHDFVEPEVDEAPTITGGASRGRNGKGLDAANDESDTPNPSSILYFSPLPLPILRTPSSKAPPHQCRPFPSEHHQRR
ncbi:hypothetical protein PIB30_056260 [Stylosanthes scabra]|uniref:Uncharacterized protein n=1 Tax=Stylosanthes scabra TaxID=79078 RepID=A0ABU6QJ88_9FABA|nr:hypothetical protein [Stylosanthes scabra]